MTSPSFSSRVAGAILGAAVGDALGYPVEFLRSLGAIREQYGPAGVTGFVRYWDRGGKHFAPYSDDTQMAEVVLRTLLWSRANEADLDATMRRLAEGFVSWSREPLGGHRAPGRSCMAGCHALEAGASWHDAGAEDAGGCGSVMRAYPVALAFVGDPERAEEWAVAQSKLTHRAPIALAACAAMVQGMLNALAGVGIGDVLASMRAAAARYSSETAQMVADATRLAADGSLPEVVLERFQGWAAHEAIAAAAFVFGRHADAPREALLEAVNSPGDSDSIGTLVGALVGARNGIETIPTEWSRDVERSEEIHGLAREAAAAFARGQ
jgi:ADP-ribosylglycohydrolase